MGPEHITALDIVFAYLHNSLMILFETSDRQRCKSLAFVNLWLPKTRRFPAMPSALAPSKHLTKAAGATKG